MANPDTWLGTALREVAATAAVEAAMAVADVAVEEAEVLPEAAISVVSRAISQGSARTGVKPVISISPSLCLWWWSVWFLLNRVVVSKNEKLVLSVWKYSVLWVMSFDFNLWNST